MTISHVITQFHTPPDREGAKFLKKGQKVSRGGRGELEFFNLREGVWPKRGWLNFIGGLHFFSFYLE